MRHIRLSIIALIGLVCLLCGLPVMAQDDDTTSYFEAQLLTAIGTAGDTPFGILLEVPAGVSQTKLHLNDAVLTMAGDTLMLWRGELFVDVNALEQALKNGIDLTSKRRPDRWEVDVIRGVATVELTNENGTPYSVVLIPGITATFTRNNQGRNTVEVHPQTTKNATNAAAVASVRGHDNTKPPMTQEQVAKLNTAQPLLNDIEDLEKAGVVAEHLTDSHSKAPFNTNENTLDTTAVEEFHLIHYLLNDVGFTTDELTGYVVDYPDLAEMFMDEIRYDPGAVASLKEDVLDDPAVLDILVGISKTDARAVDTMIEVVVGDPVAVEYLIETLKADEEAGDIFMDRLSDPGTQLVIIDAIYMWMVGEPAYFYLPELFGGFMDVDPEAGASLLVDVLSGPYLSEGSIELVTQVFLGDPTYIYPFVDLAITDPDAADLLVGSIITDPEMAATMFRLAEEKTSEGEAIKDFLIAHPEAFEAVYGYPLWVRATPTSILLIDEPVVSLEPTAQPTAEATPAVNTDVVSGPAAPPAPADADGDTIPDATDNCPTVANAGQEDADVDALGDACDTDLTGTTGIDTIDITGSGSGSLNGTAFTGTSNIDASDDNDTLNIQGGASLSGTLNGGNGTDTIDLSSAAGALVLNSADGGTANGITFASVEQVTFGGSADTVTINAGGSLSGTLDAGGGADTIDLSSGAGTLVLNSANGGTANGTTFVSVEQVTFGGTADTVTINAGGSLAGTIDAGGGADALNSTAATTLLLSGANGGTVNGAAFANIEQVTLSGNVDTVTINAGASLGGTLDGGGGTDTMDLSSGTGALLLSGANGGTANGITFANMEQVTFGGTADTITINAGGSLAGTIDAGGGNDIIDLSAVAGTLVLNSANGGTANGTTFTNVEQVTFGGSADTITINTGGSLSSTIDAGSGIDVIDLSSGTGTLVLNSANGGTANGSAFTNVEQVTFGGNADTITINAGGSLTGGLDGGGGADTLSSTATTSLVLTSANGGTANGAGFVNIEQVTLSGNADTVTINTGGSLSGTLDGGAGTDTIDLSSGAGTLVLSSANGGTANGTTFTSVEQVTLGGSADNITINAGGSLGSTIDAGGGTDTLTLGGTPTVAITGATSTMNVIVNNGVSTTVNNVEAIAGGSSTGTFNLSGTGGTGAANSLQINASGGANVFNIQTGMTGYWTIAGSGELNFSAQTAGVTVNLSNTTTHQNVFGGLFLLVQGTIDRLIGGSGNDNLKGGVANETIDGGAGDDALNGGDGNDTVTGGTGNDTVYGGLGSDTVDGGDDVDTVYGGADGQGGSDGTDTITDSDASYDVLYGGSNNYNTSGVAQDSGDIFNISGSGTGTVYGGNNNSANLSANDGNDSIQMSGTTTMSIYGGNQNTGGYGTDGDDVINDQSTGSNVIYAGNYNTSAGCNDGTGVACADGSDSITSTNNNITVVVGGNYSTSGADGNDAGNIITVAYGTGEVYGGNLNDSLGSVGDDLGTDSITIAATASNVTVYGGNYNLGVGNDGSDNITDANDVANIVYGGNRNVTGSSACDGTNCNDAGDSIQDTATDTSAIDTYYGGNLNKTGIGNDNGTADIIQSTTATNDIIYTGNNNSGGSGADTNGGTVIGGDVADGGNNP